jgi:hypothetical protein
VYAAACAGCHKPDRRGDGDRVPSLVALGARRSAGEAARRRAPARRAGRRTRASRPRARRAARRRRPIAWPATSAGATPTATRP